MCDLEPEELAERLAWLAAAEAGLARSGDRAGPALPELEALARPVEA